MINGLAWRVGWLDKDTPSACRFLAHADGESWPIPLDP
jgi:hypothetical protein